MGRVIFISALLGLIGLSPIDAGAAPLKSMMEPNTGLTFVQLEKGCFNIGQVSGQLKQKAKEDLIRSQQIRELDALESDSLIDAGESIDQPSQSDGVHVCLKKSFWIATHELTQGLYKQVMGENPSAFQKGDAYPVDSVRWFDAKKFIRTLNKQTGKSFRLPSEAEWEYAARGGGKSVAGDIDNVAWYMGNSNNQPHPVAGKAANGFGLYDMRGNVWEWTQDCWNESVKNIPRDGSASSVGLCTKRVLRGGSWYDAEPYVRADSRISNDSDRFDHNSGFRLVMD